MAINKHIPVSATWAASIAAFVVVITMFISADTVGNNFDQDRYYTAKFAIPALLMLLGIIILQRWVSKRVLLTIILSFEVVALFLYGGIALTFATWNGDNVIFIASYVEVYYGYILGAVIAGLFPLIYLASLQRVAELKRVHATGEMLITIMRDVAFAVAMAIGVLLIATRVTLGISHLVLGSIVGVAYVGDFLREGRDEGTAGSSAREEPVGMRDHTATMQSSSKAKNAFVVIIVVLFTLGAGFLWPNNFIKAGEDPIFYQVNPRVMLGENLMALVVFEIGLLLGLTLFKPLVQRLNKVEDFERLAGTASATILAAIWALLLLGWPVLPISITTALTPWGLLFLWAWISAFAARRQRASPGLLGALFLAVGGGTWLGLLVSTDPGIDGILYIVTGLLAIIFLFQILIYAVINPRFVNGRQDPDVQASEGRRASHVQAGVLASIKKQRIPVAVIAMALLIVPPAFMIGEAAASPSNFQLLANVNNDCIFYLADPMTRIDRTYMPNFGLSAYDRPNNNISIWAAKGEYEPVQVVMRPLNVPHYSIYDISFSNLYHTASPATFIDKSNFVAFRNEYVEGLSNIVPDMLVNFSMLVVAGNINTPIWLRFYIPNSTTEGDYSGTVTFKIDDKSIQPAEFINFKLVTFNIKLHVFNFTIPQVPTLKSFMGFSGTNFNATMRMFQQYRMMYWVHVPMPTCTIYDNGTVNTIDFTAMDATFNRYHAYDMHTFDFSYSWPFSMWSRFGVVIGGINYTNSNFSLLPTYNQTLSQYINRVEAHLKTKFYIDSFGHNITWYDELYCYGFDEVDNHPEEKIQEIIGTYNWLKHTVNMTLPILQTTAGGGREDLARAVDIQCFHNTGHEPEIIGKYRSHFEEVWMFSTRGPRFPNPSISSGGFQIQSRAIAWECFIYNYSHYLIWDTATQSNGGYGYGYQGWNGGSLLYNVPGGYAPSARMEVFRDGFEDHDYFTILKNKPASPQRDALLSRVDGLMSGFQPTMDYRDFARLRIDIGTFLSV
nr:hypothetical protein [Candidatus Sigynarchaeum springense]